MPIVLYGQEFWNSVINFQEMARRGIIDHQDVALFHLVDSVEQAYSYLTNELTQHYLSRNNRHRDRAANATGKSARTTGQ